MRERRAQRERREGTHLVEQFGALDADKVGPALVGDRLGEERLAAPRRAPQQHPARRVEPEEAEHVRAADGPHDAHAHLVAHGSEGAEVVPGHVRDGGEALALGRGLDDAEGTDKVGVGEGDGGELVGGEGGGVCAEEGGDGEGREGGG